LFTILSASDARLSAYTGGYLTEVITHLCHFAVLRWIMKSWKRLPYMWNSSNWLLTSHSRTIDKIQRLAPNVSGAYIRIERQVKKSKISINYCHW